MTNESLAKLIRLRALDGMMQELDTASINLAQGIILSALDAQRAPRPEAAPTAAMQARAEAAEADWQACEKALAEARRLIEWAVNAMPLELVSQWEGVRAWLEQQAVEYQEGGTRQNPGALIENPLRAWMAKHGYSSDSHVDTLIWKFFRQLDASTPQMER